MFLLDLSTTRAVNRSGRGSLHACARLVNRLCVIGIISVIPALSQINTADVWGQTTDQSSAAVPNATVTAKNLQTNLTRSIVSDSQGDYRLQQLPIGDYEISVEAPGFKKQIRSGLTVAAGDRLELNFQLTLGAVSESIDVKGGAPLVNTASAELGVTIDHSKVANLPLNGRNFTQLVSLQPGVQSSAVNGRNSFNLNGLSQWGLNFTVEGTDASFIETPTFGDPSGRTLLNTVSVDSIEEFRVQSGTFTAETGRASGGAVNVIMRSGTNAVHGLAYEYLRNDALDARNFFSATKASLRQNQFGGNLGGPIKQDRLFYFASYEQAYRRIGQLITSVVPSAAFRATAPPATQAYLNRVPLPASPLNANSGVARRNDVFSDDEHLGTIKADYLRSRSVTTLRYNVNQSFNSNPNLLPDNRQNYSITNHLAAIGNVFNLNPNTINEFRVGLNRWDVPRTNTTFDNGVGEIIITDILPTGNFEGLLHFVDTAYSVSDNLSHQVGRHSLKAGFEVRRVQSNRQQKQNPTYTYNTAADFLANKVASVRLIFGTPGSGLRQTEYGAFLQDDIHVNSRLTLNLGLRYEKYSVWSETAGRLYNVVGDPLGPFTQRGQPIYKPDSNNFNPRFGFAFDPRGDQRTSIRGGIGVYSAPLAAIWAWSNPTVDPLEPFAFNATPQDIPGLGFPISAALNSAVKNPALAPQLGLLPSVVGRLLLDPNIRDTYSVQWNLTVQQKLARNLFMQAAYVGNHALKTPNTRSLNDINPGTGLRDDSSIGEVQILEDSGKRKYHSLQVSVSQRFERGLSFDSHYTWAHSIVYGGDDCCSGSIQRVQDWNNIAGSTGNANTDITHTSTSSLSYELPVGSLGQGKPWRQFLTGWGIQGIVTIRSGMPITIYSGKDIAGNGLPATQRVNYLGGPLYASNQSISQWFNVSAFAYPTTGTFGNIGFNTLRGPILVQPDLSLVKRTTLWKEHQLVFRAEAFNAFNHTNFGNPTSTFSSAAFGKILTANNPRQLQLALRYEF